MGKKVFLIHGWSVTSTSTYQAFHEKLRQYGYAPHDICLGRYVSLDDSVTLADLSRAMHGELCRILGSPPWPAFHMVTHSTGALIVRDWLATHYSGRFLDGQPVQNAVFLAAPHFGSRLAHHGRSMMAYARYAGDTGRQLLTSLELGSDFLWENSGICLETCFWKDRGIRPFCLIGDRVIQNRFNARIFPAGYEKGSDMVVRVPAGNLNFRRYRVDGGSGQLSTVGEATGIPFAALADYVHSGPEAGIVNSITRSAAPESRHLNLQLILKCLAVEDEAGWAQVRSDLASVTAATRQRRQGFAQLDFRFTDEAGRPINDYVFVLGAVVGGAEKPSKTVAHIHRNKVSASHLTAFLNLKEFEPDLEYFMDFRAETGTPLVSYRPAPVRITATGRQLTDIVCSDRVTQLEVVLRREPSEKLFVFTPSDDPGTRWHVKWDRCGNIVKDNQKIC
jgi:hypothetical protein